MAHGEGSSCYPPLPPSSTANTKKILATTKEKSSFSFLAETIRQLKIPSEEQQRQGPRRLSIGVDLGSANIRVAKAVIYKGSTGQNEPQVELLNGGEPIPSVFCMSDGKRHFGAAAISIADQHPNSLIFDANKVMMPDDYHPSIPASKPDRKSSFDSQWYAQMGSVQNGKYTVKHLGLSTWEEISQPEIIAAFLAYVRDLVLSEEEGRAGEGGRESVEIVSLTIVVPSFCGQNHRQIVLQGAKIAGFSEPNTKVHLINQTTAIATAFKSIYCTKTDNTDFRQGLNLQSKTSKNVLILAIGADSVECSIFAFEAGKMGRLLATRGFVGFGGHCFTQSLFDATIQTLRKEMEGGNEKNFNLSAELRKRIWFACEAAKVELSARKESTIQFTMENGLSMGFRCSIENFETLVSDHIKHLRLLVKEVAAELETGQKIHHFVLAGGGSHLPFVRKMLTSLFKAQNTTVPPWMSNGDYLDMLIVNEISLPAEEAAARGAALKAAAALRPMTFELLPNVQQFDIPEHLFVPLTISFVKSAWGRQKIKLAPPTAPLPLAGKAMVPAGSASLEIEEEISSYEINNNNIQNRLTNPLSSTTGTRTISHWSVGDLTSAAEKLFDYSVSAETGILSVVQKEVKNILLLYPENWEGKEKKTILSKDSNTNDDDVVLFSRRNWGLLDPQAESLAVQAFTLYEQRQLEQKLRTEEEAKAERFRQQEIEEARAEAVQLIIDAKRRAAEEEDAAKRKREAEEAEALRREAAERKQEKMKRKKEEKKLRQEARRKAAGSISEETQVLLHFLPLCEEEEAVAEGDVPVEIELYRTETEIRRQRQQIDEETLLLAKRLEDEEKRKMRVDEMGERRRLAKEQQQQQQRQRAADSESETSSSRNNNNSQISSPKKKASAMTGEVSNESTTTSSGENHPRQKQGAKEFHQYNDDKIIMEDVSSAALLLPDCVVRFEAIKQRLDDEMPQFNRKIHQILQKGKQCPHFPEYEAKRDCLTLKARRIQKLSTLASNYGKAECQQLIVELQQGTLEIMEMAETLALVVDLVESAYKIHDFVKSNHLVFHHWHKSFRDLRLHVKSFRSKISQRPSSSRGELIDTFDQFCDSVGESYAGRMKDKLKNAQLDNILVENRAKEWPNRYEKDEN